ncbi:MAG: type II toxin-antitoxin system VapC family toxin [Chloroflexi bacterium]|nr:MAG: type II toxin-antitoxin system VapC family toxin [Chloroflexota bacterium]
MTEYLIDTSTASFVINGNASVAEALRRAVDHGQVYCSVVTEGELLTGAYRAGRARRDELADEISFFFRQLTDVLPVTRIIASAWARLRAVTLAAGQAPPANDLWIAATAVARDMVLVAHDAHFSRIPGLALEDWLADG